jgi:hypothetical protein
MRQLPEYQASATKEGLVQIEFDPPVTKGTLGIPFSYVVLQDKNTALESNRFGRIRRLTCEASRWASYLKTYGLPLEHIEDFKERVGYVEPEPVPAPQAEDAPAGK